VFIDPLRPDAHGQDYVVEATPTRLIVLDANVDGMPDVVTMNRGLDYQDEESGGPSISIVLGIGDGRFNALTDYLAEPWTRYPHDPNWEGVGPLEPFTPQGDALPGLLVERRSSIDFMRNDGRGGLMAPVSVMPPGKIRQVVDLDGDGLDDLILGPDPTMWLGEEDAYEIRYGDGSASFGESINLMMRRLWVASDVDGDGLPDLLHNSERILSGDFLTAELMYRRNLGGRSFGPPQPLGVDLFWFDRVMASLDLDGKRGDELLIVRSYPNALDSLRVFTNVGGKRYVLDHTEPIQFDRPVSHRYWERADRLFVGDMNGDGRRDIVVFSTSFW
jgi:hypothetical protein